MASQLARQLGPRGVGHWGSPYSTHKNMYRLDKLRSALTEARLKTAKKQLIRSIL